MVYEGTFYPDIYSNENLAQQLEDAAARIREHDSNLIRVELANIAIEIDRNDEGLWVIA